jgi:hypothetical protein
MAAVEAIVFAGAAGFAVIVVATILVIIGVRQEQRVMEREGRQTFARQEPPTILALLARRVLGAHFNRVPGELPHHLKSDYPDYPGPGYPGAGYPGRDDPGEDPPADDRPAWPEAG